MHIQAKLVNGEIIEQTIDANRCVIGRSSKCDVVIPHEGMSRLHCQIEFIDGEYFITDLGSTNGVLIDNQKIEPHQKTPYQTFLLLSFGAVQSLQISDHTFSDAPLRGKVTETESLESSGLTRTRTLRPGQRDNRVSGKSEGVGESSEQRDGQDKIRLLVSALLAILLIGGAFYFYEHNDQEALNFNSSKSDQEIPENPF